MKAGIIGASKEAIYAIKKAQSMGIEVIGLDGDCEAAGLKIVDEGIVIDISKEEEVIKILRNKKIDFLLPIPIGRYLTTSGYINENLKLKGLNYSSSILCTDKYLFHEKLSENNLRNIMCILVNNKTKKNMIKIKFPAIIKPRFGSGSRGVALIKTQEELNKELNKSFEEDYILEEAVEGEEYGLDGAVVDGKFQLVLLRKKINTPPPVRQAIGYYSVNDTDKIVEVEKYIQKAIDVMKLDNCLLHTDLIINENKIFLIEISGRPSGHRLHNLFTPLVTGVDMIEQYINFMKGEYYNFKAKQTSKMAIRYFDFENCNIKEIPDFNKLKNNSEFGIIDYEINIKKDEFMEKIKDGHSIMSRGYFIVQGDNEDDLNKKISKIFQEFIIENIEDKNKKMKKQKEYLIPVIPFNESIITKAKGSYVYDSYGKKYLDVNSGQFCSILGHSNEEVAKKISNTALKVQHTNTAMITEETLNCVENLNRISSKMNAKSILLSTGSEAIEFALRIGKSIKGKSGIICFNKGYHGLSLGAQSVTFGGKYAFPSIEDIFVIDVPDFRVGSLKKYMDKLEDYFAEYADKVGVVLLEPIVSVGGMLFPEKEYFWKIRALCDKYNIFLAFDECQTGFGRTGEWFYFQKINCIPDILISAKGIGLGYPVSIVMLKDDIIPKEGLKITHYSSHQNDAFSASIINFGIEFIEKNKVLNQVIEKGKYFLENLLQLEKEFEIVKNVRGIGLMMGFDLNIPGIVDYRSISKTLLQKIQDEGVILQATDGGKTIRFLPSYLITYKEIDYCIEKIKKVFIKFYEEY